MPRQQQSWTKKRKQNKLVCLNPLQCTKIFLHEKLFKTMFVGGSACLTIVRVGMQVMGVLALAHVLEQSKVLIHLLSSCTAAHAVATAMLLLPLLLLLMLLHLPCNYLQLHLSGSPAAAPAFHSSFLNWLATSLVLLTHFRTELTLCSTCSSRTTKHFRCSQMKNISCCWCWLLLSFSAVGCKQTSFEKKKKRWGTLQTVVSDYFKNFFRKKKQETDCHAEEEELQGRRQKPNPAKNFRNSSSSN